MSRASDLGPLEAIQATTTRAFDDGVEEGDRRDAPLRDVDHVARAERRRARGAVWSVASRVEVS